MFLTTIKKLVRKGLAGLVLAGSFASMGQTTHTYPALDTNNSYTNDNHFNKLYYSVFLGGVETSAPSGVVGQDLLWASSANHRLMENPNNAGAIILSGIASAGVAGHCPQFATNGIDLVDSGAGCGGAGGGITALTGDGTAAGSGSVVFTLATVNGGPGACGDSTHVCQITTNGKGLVTAQTAVSISGGGGGSGTVVASPQFQLPYYDQAGTVAHVVGDSHITTDGSGNLTVVSLTTVGCGGCGGGNNWTEGTAPTPAGGVDDIWASSTTHRIMENPNNTGSLILSGIASAGTSGHCVELAINGIDLVDAGGACGAGGSGSVTSVAQTVPSSLLTIGGSPITVSGTLAIGLANAGANTVWGNATGSTGAPGYTSTPVVASLTTAGTTAGFIDFVQGTTSSGVGPCNTGNSWCIQAPLSLSSNFVETLPTPSTGIRLYTLSGSTITDTMISLGGGGTVIATGPSSVTSGDLVSYNNINATQADSGIALVNVVQATATPSAGFALFNGSTMTVTSVPKAGSGAGVVTGPTSGVTNGDAVCYTGTGGQTQDCGGGPTSPLALNNTWTGTNGYANTLTLNTLGTATTSANFNSNIMNFAASGWTISAQPCTWGVQNILGAGHTPTTTLTFTGGFNCVTPYASFPGVITPLLKTNTSSNTDLAGTVTLSGGTGSYSFTGTYTSAPICVATDATAANATKVAVTTSTLTITGTTTDSIDYICVARN